MRLSDGSHFSDMALGDYALSHSGEAVLIALPTGKNVIAHKPQWEFTEEAGELTISPEIDGYKLVSGRLSKS